MFRYLLFSVFFLVTSPIAELTKLNIKLKIDSYSSDEISDFDYTFGGAVIANSSLLDSSFPIVGYIFGLPVMIRQLLNEKENRDLTTYLLKINENLINIDSMVVKYKNDNAPISVFAFSNIPKQKLPNGKVELRNLTDFLILKSKIEDFE